MCVCVDVDVDLCTCKFGLTQYIYIHYICIICTYVCMCVNTYRVNPSSCGRRATRARHKGIYREILFTIYIYMYIYICIYICVCV